MIGKVTGREVHGRKGWKGERPNSERETEEENREGDGKENRTMLSLGKRRTIRVCGGVSE